MLSWLANWNADRVNILIGVLWWFFFCKILTIFRENTFRAIEKQLPKINNSKERVSALRKYRKEIATKDLIKLTKCSKFTDSKLVTITLGCCNQNNFFTNEEHSEVKIKIINDLVIMINFMFKLQIPFCIHSWSFIILEQLTLDILLKTFGISFTLQQIQIGENSI